MWKSVRGGHLEGTARLKTELWESPGRCGHRRCLGWRSTAGPSWEACFHHGENYRWHHSLAENKVKLENRLLSWTRPRWLIIRFVFWRLPYTDMRLEGERRVWKPDSFWNSDYMERVRGIWAEWLWTFSFTQLSPQAWHRTKCLHQLQQASRGRSRQHLGNLGQAAKAVNVGVVLS